MGQRGYSAEQIDNELLEPAILFFELLEPTHLGHANARKLLFPRVERLPTDLHLAAHITHQSTTLGIERVSKGERAMLAVLLATSLARPLL